MKTTATHTKAFTKFSLAILMTAVLCFSLAVFAPPAEGQTASVSGNVQTEDGQPIQGLRVQAFSGKCWNGYLGEAFTDGSGNYTITIPDPPPAEVYVLA
ncbi:MAG: carboxypeptidase regulatory-like domain-containing protein, partial [Deltaproteobacteria bacterium]